MDNYILTHTPTAIHWQQMQQLIEDANWASDDRSVLQMLSNFPTTRAIFAVCGDKLLGFVVWNEAKAAEIVWIGFYFVIEALRGQGLGQILWQNMLNKVGKSTTLGLRTFDGMARKYRNNGFPIDGKSMEKFLVKCGDLQRALQAHPFKASICGIETESINNARFDQLCQFDASVTKQNRRELLMRFLQHDNVAVVNALCEGAIVGYGATVPTGPPELRQLKVAPLYAPNLPVALLLMRELLTMTAPADTTVVIYIMEESAGDKDFLNFLLDNANAIHQLTNTTLLSGEKTFPIDYSVCYIPHNHCCHIDT